jgi:hypothetical protein
MTSQADRRANGLVALTLLLASLACWAPTAAAQRATKGDIRAGLKTYDSPYYTVHSDLEKDRVQEALLRMTRMAEEYHARTKDFSGVIRHKFPFYLFTEADDYHAAGGMAGSAGVFIVRGNEARLMAIAGKRDTKFTWHVVQHEGFHQFAHAVIGGDLPIWVNEGLAEYFGEGIFTGDGYVTGVVSPTRAKRIKHSIENKRFKSIQDMMLLTHQRWNAEMNPSNYDMAWSMTHFLAHGENGKYQGAFAQFVRDIGRNRPWDKAWEANFGSADGFEKKWSDYWLKLDPLVTKDLYVKAAVSAMTSFLGRAVTQKQSFDNLDEFMRVAKGGTLKIPDTDWLPPSLIASMLNLREQLGDEIKYEMSKDPKAPPQITATLPDSTRIVATYNRTAKAGPARVTVTIDDMIPKLAEAKALIAAKKKPEAKAVLQDAIKRNPKSPQVEEARKLLPQTL